MMKTLLVIFFISMKVFSAECEKSAQTGEIKPLYSKHFAVKVFNGYKIVFSDTNKYLLADKKPLCEFDGVWIKTPVKKVAMTSTTFLPALEFLSEQKSLMAFQGKNYIVSENFSKNIKNISFKFNPEELLTLNADLIMGYDGNLQSDKQKIVFKKINLPVVLNNDYKESNPLARAEWIIFISTFYNKEMETIRFFKDIELNYQLLKNQKYKNKPRVLVGDIQNGFWMTCGGKSDLAQIIEDAGGELVLKNEKIDTQRVGLEAVYSQAGRVDVWLPQNSWTNGEWKKDKRYQFIKASSIFNNNKILNSHGSNDYWETGMQRPDLLLKDLTNLIQMKKNSDLKWYRPL